MATNSLPPSSLSAAAPAPAADDTRDSTKTEIMAPGPPYTDGRNTASIDILLARAAFGVPAPIPSTDSDLRKGTIRCQQIQDIKNEITELQDDRDSIYRVQAQVTTLGPNLEANTVIKPETKRLLKANIDNLTDLVNQGIALDSNFTTLEMESSELADEHLDLMKEHYEPARKKRKTTLNEVAKKVEERSKEVNRLKRSFDHLHPRIADMYMRTRDALPGTGPLNLKPFSSLTSSPASDAAQPATKKRRLGGSD